MPNIFTAVQILKDLQNYPNITVEQKKFLNTLLDENKLSMVLKNPTSIKIEPIIKLLTDEFNQTSYWNLTSPIANMKYIKDLKKVLNILNTLKNFFAELDKPDRPKPPITAITRNIDLIYEETVKTYEGQILLPIRQSADVGIRPFAEGQCFGFVAKWAIDLLNKKAAFGVHIDQMPVFTPIKLTSTAGQKYPDLNHLARLTETISSYQANQKHLKKFLQSLSNDETKNIDIEKEIYPHFYESISQMGRDLVRMAENNGDDVIGLNMFGYRAGHALGFYHQNNKYHFFDSNSGWYRFNDAGAFVRWFPFYFYAMTYDKHFLEKNIIRYSKNPITDKDPLADLNIYSLIGLNLLLAPITVPTITGLLSYYFGVRGIIYGTYNLKNIFTDLLFSKKIDTENKSDQLGLIKQDDTNTNESLTSYRRLDALLDISKADIINLEKRIAISEFLGPKQDNAVPVEPSNVAHHILFSNFNTDTVKMIDSAIYNIEHSLQSYRREAKKQKLNVLKAAKDFLDKKISYEQFKLELQTNPNYVDAMGRSNTEIIVHRVLKIGSANVVNDNDNLEKIIGYKSSP